MHEVLAGNWLEPCLRKALVPQPKDMTIQNLNGLPQESLIPQALQSFRKIAGPLGMKLGMFSATLLSSQEKPGSVVLRLSDGERQLLLKWVELPDQARELIASAVAQEVAREALWGFPNLKVPKVLAQSLADRAVLAEEPPGVPLETRMIESGNIAALLEMAGTWLNAFHRETFFENRPFQPVFVKNHLSRMMAEVAKRPESTPASNEFLAHAEALLVSADRLQDHPIKSSQSHGDFTLRHLITAGEQITVINFRPATKASGAIDTARILSDVMQIIVPVEGETNELILPEALQTAFFGAYSNLGPQDPILQLMLRVRVLAEWRAIPARVPARSWRQERRWAFIRSLSPSVFSA